MYLIKCFFLSAIALFSAANAATLEYSLRNNSSGVRIVRINSDAWVALQFSNIVDASFSDGRKELTLPPYFDGRISVNISANEERWLRAPEQLINLKKQESEKLRDWLNQYPGYRYREGNALEDCNGAALLLVEMAKQAGHEAMPVTGLVYNSRDPGKPFYHAWAKIKVNDIWFDADIFAIDKKEKMTAAVVFGTWPDFKLSELIE